MATSEGFPFQAQSQTFEPAEGSSSRIDSRAPAKRPGTHVEWEWCNDSFIWTPYPPPISSSIESAFLSGCPSVDFSLSKSSYSIFFEKSQMVQRNLRSRRARPVKREVMDGRQASGFWWENERQAWNAYSSELAQHIEKVWQDSNITKSHGRSPSGCCFKIHNQVYGIEFEGDGTQYNLLTNYSRSVRRRLCLCESNVQDGNDTSLMSVGLRSSSGQHDPDYPATSFPSSSVTSFSGNILEEHVHPKIMSSTCDGSCENQGQSQYSSIMVDLANPPKTEDCAICLSGLQEEGGVVELLKCRHLYHRSCILSWFRNRPICPTCSALCGVITGNQPSGEMRVQYLPFREGQWDLAGYPNTDVIKITYSFPSGVQSSEHPNPGRPYAGTIRTAYLPKNRDGEELLNLLKVAWRRRLLFRIGTSVTTGVNNVITWAGIHHKTHMKGGSAYHGYVRTL
ncbi:hypothetical protein KP509_09G067700 [Ceratopteris richardii]|uniref:RING-type E3 ubiquitin transferase n=1 Tax=Ceratopteris richardii TaxID=49495 RepID=A0A8T2U5L4_CERRI|nr:hypothetical protein KP509_09G067700 [Ceratopteris richardii]